MKGEEAFASSLDSYEAMEKTFRLCMVFLVLNESGCQQFVVEVTHGFGVDYRQLNKRSKKNDKKVSRGFIVHQKLVKRLTKS